MRGLNELVDFLEFSSPVVVLVRQPIRSNRDKHSYDGRRVHVLDLRTYRVAFPDSLTSASRSLPRVRAGNCFGVATAAKVPVKRYNLLVPAIFPVTEPNPDKPLSVGVEKNINRLSEYLGRNEHRIPKASRRLARTIHTDLKRKKLGYVKVGMHAFQVLLHACDSRFARLYAQELLVRYPKRSVRFEALHRELTSSSTANSNPVITSAMPNQHETSVVGVLLADKDVRAQRMGIELLLCILKIQDSAEYISSLDNFVPMLCRLAVDEVSAAESVSAIAPQCLLEHLRLCSRISYIAKNMDVVTSAVMEIIEREGGAAVDAYELSREVESLASIGRMSIGARIGASPPCQAAVLIFKEIGSVSHDSVESRNVVEYWIKFMDREPSRWYGGASLRVGLGVLRDSCTIEHQKYVIACALVRHLASSSYKSPEHLGALVRAVLSQSTLLEPTNTAAVLLLTIRTLGSMLEADSEGIRSPNSMLAKTARHAVQTIAIQTGCRAQVASAIEAALLHPSNVLGTVFLCESVSAVYLDIPVQGGDSIKADGGISPARGTEINDASSRNNRIIASRHPLPSKHTDAYTISSSKSADDSVNVTETMVTAVQSLLMTVAHADRPFIVLNSLSILRHTLEATAPDSYTSARAARALMCFMWSVIGDPDATPAMLVAVQGLFRAFTETAISKNHGDVLAVLFAASINRELKSCWETSSTAFCDNIGVSASQVVAVATITRGLWECLSKSDVHGNFEAFKPAVVVGGNGGNQQPLETNSIGLAVVREGVDPSASFSRFNRDPDVEITVAHPHPEAVLKALSLSSDALGPSVGRIEFLHGSENHSPRKASKNIVSAINRVVSVERASTEIVHVDRVDDGDAGSMGRGQTRVAMSRGGQGEYESGMAALVGVAQKVM